MATFDVTYRNDNAVIDLTEYLRERLERINFEIEPFIAYKVAEQMRELGWTCIPPREGPYKVAERMRELGWTCIPPGGRP